MDFGNQSTLRKNFSTGDKQKTSISHIPHNGKYLVFKTIIMQITFSI